MNKIIFGIDEAGLGPTLGPLCYGWTGLIQTEGSNVLSRFDQLIKKYKLNIGDSKKIYQGVNKKKKLHQALNEVLSLSQQTSEYQTLSDLWNLYPLNSFGEISMYSYYEKCLKHSFAQLSVLERKDQFDGFCGFTASFEGELNKEFDRGVNKSAVSMMKIGEIILSILNRFPIENIEIQVDKQGGRNFYEDFLNDLFPFVGIQILRESSDESIYMISEENRDIKIGFYKKGEDRFSLIACGSILAKWLREQFMASFNSYWLTYNDVKPTAGYPEDAKRFIEVMSEYFEQDSMPINFIIRSR
ncbi:MAG: hypothetical protein COA79_19615 [Planctomycetota bacterium]|nr:MAG: hypothetical protein COA79_19615 [Planctomycetota bacterium]